MKGRIGGWRGKIGSHQGCGRVEMHQFAELQLSPQRELQRPPGSNLGLTKARCKSHIQAVTALAVSQVTRPFRRQARPSFSTLA